jgi:hypothetical protein
MVPIGHNAQFQKVAMYDECYKKRVIDEVWLRDKCIKVFH